MLEPSKLTQILKEMYLLNIKVLGLCETRWPGSGEKLNSNGSLLIYLGKEENEERIGGVGIILSKIARNSLLSWHPVSDRIITVRLKTPVRKTSIVQCYAPTEISNKEQKEDFHEKLTGVLQKINKGDIIVMMGDLNAKVGNNNTNFEDIMGRHGVGTRNENGRLLVELCLENNLVIGGTLFPHREYHKITWISPDKTTENQIDHIMISKKWENCLLDVHNKRSADVGSDHHLLIAEMGMKLKRKNKNMQIKKKE
nr:unnamed protein product [Callosobruchus analis]